MPKATDKVFRELSKYLAEHKSEIKTEEDFQKFANSFMQEYNAKNAKSTAMSKNPATTLEKDMIMEADDDRKLDTYDYLDMAEDAESDEEAIKYLNKALELDKNNLDAACMMVKLTANDPLEALERYRDIVRRGERILKKDGTFDECRGEFWAMFETRPYMRARHSLMDTLLECNMLKSAAVEAEEMLELCKSDNMGVRYTLMNIYAALEDEKSATKLYQEYSGDGNAEFLLPYSILKYRLGKFDEAAKYLKELATWNKDTKKFFKLLNNVSPRSLDKYLADFDPYYIKCGSMDEFLSAVVSFDFLMMHIGTYSLWANDILKSRKK